MELFNLILNECIDTALYCSKKGWTEGNAGNISTIIPENCFISPKHNDGWNRLPTQFLSLANQLILFSASGSIFRKANLHPDESFGIIQINEDGSAYRAIWGFANGGKPTSEWVSHLGILSSSHIPIKVSKSVLHAHTPFLTALCNLKENLSTASLTRLIWEMHGECMMFLPEGIEFIPFEVSGTQNLYEPTIVSFEQKDIALWEYHGAVACGSSLSLALGKMEMCEKAAANYCMVMSAGGFKKKLSQKQLLKIASSFSLLPEKSALKNG